MVVDSRVTRTWRKKRLNSDSCKAKHKGGLKSITSIYVNDERGSLSVRSVSPFIYIIAGTASAIFIGQIGIKCRKVFKQ